MNQSAASTWWDRNREWALPGGIALYACCQAVCRQVALASRSARQSQLTLLGATSGSRMQTEI